MVVDEAVYSFVVALPRAAPVFALMTIPPPDWIYVMQSVPLTTAHVGMSMSPRLRTVHIKMLWAGKQISLPRRRQSARGSRSCLITVDKQFVVHKLFCGTSVPVLEILLTEAQS